MKVYANPLPNVKPTHMVLRAHELKFPVEGRGQRPYYPQKAREYALTWNDALVGTLQVTWRADGGFYVDDGQHRVRAQTDFLKNMNYEFDCLVHENITEDQESQVFLGASNAKPVKAREKFAAKLYALEGEAVEIRKVVESCGFTVTTNGSGSHNAIVCIGTLEQIFKDGKAEGLRETLDLIRDAWGTDEQSAMSASIIGGVFRFHRKYRTVYKRERLVNVLSALSPKRLHAQAGGILVGNYADNVGKVIAQKYNARLSRGRLE